MITGYHRPQSMNEAINLILRTDIKTKPIGGGTTLSHSTDEAFEVLDLQDLPLKNICLVQDVYIIGAGVTLQQIKESEIVYRHFPQLAQVINQECAQNLQNMATLAGLITTADGRSPLLTTLLALQPQLLLQPGNELVSIDQWLRLRHEGSPSKIIEEIRFSGTGILSFEMVARSPLDRPIVCVAAVNQKGLYHLSIGGFGAVPIFIGPFEDVSGATVQASTIVQKWDDEWASGEYRAHVVDVFIKRLFANR